MPALLKVDVSPRRERSVSRQLGQAIAADWLIKERSGRIIERDLAGPRMPLVDWEWIDAVYVQPNNPTPEGEALIRFSDVLIDELYAAEEILISTPMDNFGMPAALKGWVDQVARLNRTFTAEYKELLLGKKLNAIITSGGNYEPGSYYSKMDFCSGHLRAIMAFIGITDTKIYMAGDTHDITQGKITMSDYVSKHAPEVIEAFAR